MFEIFYMRSMVPGWWDRLMRRFGWETSSWRPFVQVAGARYWGYSWRVRLELSEGLSNFVGLKEEHLFNLTMFNGRWGKFTYKGAPAREFRTHTWFSHGASGRFAISTCVVRKAAVPYGTALVNLSYYPDHWWSALPVRRNVLFCSEQCSASHWVTGRLLPLKTAFFETARAKKVFYHPIVQFPV
jgi:hypothetical protein